MVSSETSPGTLAILGDSYSTYAGWIPEDYAAWYSPAGNALPNGVCRVEQTWWHPLLRHWRLLVNCSYSGSAVSLSGYPGMGPETSFVRRMRRDLGPELSPALVIVFGGTNDYWIGNPPGDPIYGNRKESDLVRFAPAFCEVLVFLRCRYSGAAVLHLTNDDIQGPIRTSVREICGHYGAPIWSCAPSTRKTATRARWGWRKSIGS